MAAMKIAATTCVLILIASTFPMPGAAYPGSVQGFVGGKIEATIDFGKPPIRTMAGTIRLPSNGTVTSATVDAEPTLASDSLSFVDNGAAGFGAGSASSGLSLSATGLSLSLRSGAQEFSGAGLNTGIFNGTEKSGDVVVLSGLSGTYDSPLISWDGTSYGRLSANVSMAGRATASYSIVSPAGVALQPSILPGALVTVDGALNPSIRVRVTMSASSLGDSPRIHRVGTGYVLSVGQGPSAASSEVRGLRMEQEGLALNMSHLSFSTPMADPILPPASGTWYSWSVHFRSAVVVGAQIWMYAHGSNGSAETIGRFVSDDGGSTWIADANPLLKGDPDSAGWDSAGVAIPVVLWDGAAGWQMWYAGTGQAGWDFGARVGYATSADGVNWTKYPSNPIFSTSASAWDSSAVYLGGVDKVKGTYYMYYAGRNAADYRKAVGIATSSDGISWSRYAGNPIISYATASYTSQEAYAGNAYFHDGIFYLYWICSYLVGAWGKYDVCLSTSTDGLSFSHLSANPIIAHGESWWNPDVVEGLLETTNPLSGEQLWYYYGGNNAPAYTYGGVGQAFANRDSPGSLESTWDLRAEMPHRLNAVRAEAMVPSSTALTLSISSNPSNGAFPPAEVLTLNDTSISTLPDNFARVSLIASATDTNRTPIIFGTRIEYDRYAASGRFVSAVANAPFPVATVTVAVTAGIPGGAGVELMVSNDDGTTWEAAASGSNHLFAFSGQKFRYALEFTGRSNVSAIVSEVRVDLKLAVRPSDVVLETEGGQPLGSLAGTLTGRTQVDLDAATLNALIAPMATAWPPTAVYVDLFVNSSTPGALRLSNLTIQLAFADELRVFFAPDVPSLEMALGASQLFRTVASTTPGLGLTYTWWADGVLAGSGDPNYTFVATGASSDFHVLRASVSNGQFTAEHTWNISVVAPPTSFTVGFYPWAASLTLTAGMTEKFRADASSGGGATTTWRLDGQTVSSAATYTFTASNETGLHHLDVVVTGGGQSVGWAWEITVLPPPPLPERALAVAFAPAGDVVIVQNETVVFHANLTAPAAPPVTYSWKTHGAIEGLASSGEFMVVGRTPGVYAVWVTVRNETGISTHLWNLTVLAPTRPGSGGGNQTVVAAGGLDPAALVFAVAFAALAGVFAVLYFRERSRRRSP
jgi:hypothetical protein